MRSELACRQLRAIGKRRLRHRGLGRTFGTFRQTQKLPWLCGCICCQELCECPCYDRCCAYTHPVTMSTAPSQTPTTVSLADEEAVKRILVDTVFGLWATVNNLTRLRPSRRERYRVTVFGSARTEQGERQCPDCATSNGSPANCQRVAACLCTIASMQNGRIKCRE